MLYILKGHRLYFPQKCIISLKIYFYLANSADPDEMPHNVAFQPGLHFLPNYPFSSFVCPKIDVNCPYAIS